MTLPIVVMVVLSTYIFEAVFGAVIFCNMNILHGLLMKFNVTYLISIMYSVTFCDTILDIHQSLNFTMQKHSNQILQLVHALSF